MVRLSSPITLVSHGAIGITNGRRGPARERVTVSSVIQILRYATSDLPHVIALCIAPARSRNPLACVSLLASSIVTYRSIAAPRHVASSVTDRPLSFKASIRISYYTDTMIAATSLWYLSVCRLNYCTAVVEIYSNLGCIPPLIIMHDARFMSIQLTTPTQ
ncbi:hypothetical protein J6590_078937 [Homalodisca vitripennis]|nr:hypothetical protein J6590_078937 [Homalodisca vitripennis]